MINRILYILHHIYCGYKSGIPFCCILWFISVWSWIYILTSRGKTHNLQTDVYWKQYEILTAYSNLYSDKIEYVKCPICIITKRDRMILHCGNPYKTCPPCSIYSPLKGLK